MRAWRSRRARDMESENGARDGLIQRTVHRFGPSVGEKHVLLIGTGKHARASGVAVRAADSENRCMTNTKTFFITGVSSGFGRAIANAALQAGHRVVGTVRTEQ